MISPFGAPGNRGSYYQEYNGKATWTITNKTTTPLNEQSLNDQLLIE